MAPADPNRILRLLPLFAGIVGGTVLMFNRFATADLTPSQARSDVMGVILSGVLILVGLIWQRVQPRLPDAVELIGRKGLEFAQICQNRLKLSLLGLPIYF
jgi:nitrate reductase gamma subunit